MTLVNILIEVEQKYILNKIENILRYLSNDDLIVVTQLLKRSLQESAKDFLQQKQEGKRIVGRPSDFIAYDDKTKTAKRYTETIKGLEVTHAKYTEKQINNGAEIKSFIGTLNQNEKKALVGLINNEVKKRKVNPNLKKNKQKTSGKFITELLQLLLWLGIGYGAISGIQNIKPDSVYDTKSHIMSSIHVNFNWERSSAGLLKVNFEVKNYNNFAIKDFEITCDGFAPSGTKIDSNVRIIHDIIYGNEKKEYKNFNMGFLHSQVTEVSCKVSDFKKY